MIHITLAIARFMQILAEAMFWVGARFAGYALVGAAVIAVPLWLLRKRKR